MTFVSAASGLQKTLTQIWQNNENIMRLFWKFTYRINCTVHVKSRTFALFEDLLVRIRAQRCWRERWFFHFFLVFGIFFVLIHFYGTNVIFFFLYIYIHYLNTPPTNDKFLNDIIFNVNHIKSLFKMPVPS